MQRCPICRARLKTQDVCVRCGAELALPSIARERAQFWLNTAMRHLNQGDWCMAQTAVEQASQYHHSPMAQAIVGFIAQRQQGVQNDRALARHSYNLNL